MSDEHDSWFKDAFDFDVGGAVQAIKDQASAVATQAESVVTQVVQGVQGAAEGMVDAAVGVVTGVAKTVAGATGLGDAGDGSGGSSSAGATDDAGSGSFPLRGSVGRGGKNQSGDVKAVQAALGIAADGQCGGQTIAAIEAFQRDQGLPRADGRVDPGGATEKALSGGAASAPSPAPNPDEPASAAPVASDDTSGMAGESEPTGSDDGEPSAPDPDLSAKIAGELGAQVDVHVAKQAGLVDELNNLEDFTKTDPDPVPEFTGTISNADPAALANDIKEKEFAISQMEIQRKNICKAARADARLAGETAKSNLKGALLGGAGIGSGAAGVTTVITLAGGAMLGGSLAMLAALCAGIVAEHEIARQYRDTLRTIVQKAHNDLTISNTAIAVEKKKLAAMRKAAEITINPVIIDDSPSVINVDPVEFDDRPKPR